MEIKYFNCFRQKNLEKLTCDDLLPRNSLDHLYEEEEEEEESKTKRQAGFEDFIIIDEFYVSESGGRTVSLAKCIHDEEILVALKTFKINQHSHIKVFKHIFKEIKALVTLKSEYVVEIYDVIKSDGILVIVMEYYPSLDKEKFLYKNETAIATILYGMAKCLEFCHNKGIMHRDVKRENFVVSEDYKVKLIDFGLCTFKQRSNRCAGTIDVISPEVYDKRTYTNKVDIWGMGIVIYEFFYMEDVDTDIRRDLIFNIDACLRKGTENEHEQFIDIVKGMLRRNPIKRLSIKQILEHEFIKINLVRNENKNDDA